LKKILIYLKKSLRRTQDKIKQGKDQVSAAMEVMQKYKKELQEAMK
jgi:hypothetical protein